MWWFVKPSSFYVYKFASLLSKESCIRDLKMKFVKELAESPNLISIPSTYVYSTSSTNAPALDPQNSIPSIDFSMLTSTDPNLQSQAIQELEQACKDWGFFQVINHGVPETLLNMVIEKFEEFFNLPDEEKKDFEEKEVHDQIRYGTSFNLKKDKVFCWRDFLRVVVHPKFHAPNKPLGLSDVLFEYSIRTREVFRGLLSGISTSLGLDQSYVEKALKLESGVQICIANLYPPCPQPELAIGFLPHTDHGLLTLLINNGVEGLQIKHYGKWVMVKDTIPNSFLVNIADHLEIFSNGKYKSVEHRAIVNNAVTRISVAVVNGPSLDAEVRPTEKLVDEERCPAAYLPMKYKEYLEMQLDNQLQVGTILDRVRVS